MEDPEDMREPCSATAAPRLRAELGVFVFYPLPHPVFINNLCPICQIGDIQFEGAVSTALFCALRAANWSKSFL